MNKKTKSKIAKVSIVAAAMTLTTCMGVSSLFASADNVLGKKYSSDYSSWEEIMKAGSDLNEQLAGEGFVLMKNKSNALPLASSERKVALLGKGAYTIQSGGGGSGGLGKPNYSQASASAANIETSLTAEGFTINADVKTATGAGSNADTTMYMTVLEEGEGVVEFGGKKYAASETNPYKDITIDGEVGIINLVRTGSEGYDNKAYNAQATANRQEVITHSNLDEHYLTLTDSERAVLAYAKQQKAAGALTKIIIIVNSPNVMELGDIDGDDAFDSILWIGTVGWNGANAVGKILTGEINPSGHTVDFWMSDFTTDPTWYNFSNNNQILRDDGSGNMVRGNLQLGSGNTNAGHNVAMGKTATSTADSSAEVLSYSEGIFAGYRYYETVAHDLGDAGEEWYQSVTTYPFGYGLSYTTFDQEITGITGDLTKADGTITVTVKVTNTGSKAGKEVVQLYNTPEYHEGEIDKAYVNLVGFAKTKELAAGASENVQIKIAVKDLAEFDYNDANQNGNSGYEVEAGSYVLSIRKNSHELANADTSKSTKMLTRTGNALTWDEDGNPNTPNNIFSQEDGAWEMYNTSASHWTASHVDHDLHRDTLLNEEGDGPSDLSELAWTLGEDNVFSDKAFAVLKVREITTDPTNDYDNPVTLEKEIDYTGNLWLKTAEDMKGKTQGAGTVGANGLYDITIYDVIGLEYDDAKWDELLNQVTWDEICNLIMAGGYKTAALATVGKAEVTDADGPQQLQNGWAWVSSPVIASTWNQELAYEQGKLVGTESMWNNNAGWYGPAMNNHRNPLSGRNFEYYSQDGIQGGLIAAAVVKGATDQGCRVYIKHSFLNDQETGRFTNETFVNEQAMRQIYAKPFELAIKNGNANGIMSSFNNIGLQSSASYAINTQLYTNEWGYKGTTVTDFYMSQATCGWGSYSLIRGLQIPLGTATKLPQTWDDTAKVVKNGDTADYTTWYWARETAKRILYTHANGNATKNGVGSAIGVNDVVGVTGKVLAPVTVVDMEALNEICGGAENYTVTATGLPAGLTFDPATGVVSGTPTEAKLGTFTVTVTGKDAAGWITTSGVVGISIAKGEFVLTGANCEIEVPVIKLTADNYVENGEANAANKDKYTAYSVAVNGDLPEGLNFDEETGVISGAATQKGTYTVTVTETYEKVEGVRSGWSTVYSKVAGTAVHKYVITVGVEWEVIDGHLYHMGEDIGSVQGATGLGIASATINDDGELVLTFTDGSSQVIGGVVGASGTNGTNGTNSSNGLGIAGLVMGVVGLLAAGAAVALVFLKKKN